MNITLSIDEKVAKEARKVANNMGTSLNQLIRDHLELLTKKNQSSGDLDEFIALSGQGHSAGWKFNRDELHERT
jgi:hypothetical protein